MDYEQARHNMIEQQIRPWEVLDPKVLELLARVKREDFVPTAHQSLAFVDMELPLGHGQTMWSPKLEARALQSLQLQPHDRVLEIGTGSGYFTALLAAQAGVVVTVELHAELREAAERKFRAHGLTHVQTRLGDAARDWRGDGAFDAIVLTGSTPLLPEALVRQLNPGGRLFAIVGEGPAMSAQLVTHVAGGATHADHLFETRVAPLVNALEPEHFVF